MSEVFLMAGQMWYCLALKPISGCPPMPEGTTLTVNLSPEAKAQLSHLAARTHRSPDALVTEAIESFLSRESQDVAAIEAALVEMRTATLIPHEEAMDQLDAAIKDKRVPDAGTMIAAQGPC